MLKRAHTAADLSSDAVVAGGVPRPLYSRGFEKMSRLFLRYYCPLAVVGERPCADDEPFLICANHQSHLDSVAIMVALGLPFNACGLMAAEDYFFRKARWVPLIANAMRLIPISRRVRPHEFRATIERCRTFLESGGRAILMYPEGTRSDSVERATFKRGAAVLAVQLGIPLLPVSVSGTARSLPKNSVIPRPSLITVSIGSLIRLPQVGAGVSERESSRSIAERVEADVRALRSSCRRQI